MIYRCPNCGEQVQRYDDKCPRYEEPLKTPYSNLTNREEDWEAMDNERRLEKMLTPYADTGIFSVLPYHRHRRGF